MIDMSKKKNSVQKLIGFERFTKYGVRTDKAEFAFFAVEPTNISVMSAASIDTKVHHLMMLLSTSTLPRTTFIELLRKWFCSVQGSGSTQTAAGSHLSGNAP